MVLLLLIILLIAAAAAGVLWQVLEIAAGVALGLFLFVVLLAVAGYLMIRYRVRRFRREWYGERHPSRRPRY
jgi:membrane protein implicated in regulation of membrane protease activity